MVLVLVVPSAAAQDAPVEPNEAYELDAAWLVDGGMVGLFWAPIAGAAVLQFVEPRPVPLFFSSDEGGAEALPSSVPGWIPGAGGLLLVAGAAVVPVDARWFHVKGLIQSLTMTLFMTEMSKRLFGRQRPNFSPDSTNPDSRASFFSGHTSMTASALMYASLYLRSHIFPEIFGHDDVTVVEVAWHVIAAGLLVAAGAERVVNNRHYLTDVLMGGAVGIGLSIAIFYLQESRFNAAGESDALSMDLSVASEAAMLSVSGAW